MTTLPDLPAVSAAIVEITNAKRVEAKLGRVTVSPQLTAAAKAYAEVLSRSKVFSHEADGTTMSGRIEKSGYEACTAAENLATHQSSRGFATRELAVSAMEGWLNSPGHAKNIMTPEVTETGVAIARGPDKDPKFFIVQLFGRPQSLSFDFQVSNTSAEPVAITFSGKTRDIAPKMALTLSTCQSGSLVIKANGTRPFEARYEAEAKNYVVTEPAKTSDPKAKAGSRVEVRDRIKVR
ncbi:MAG: CAP domain-containing protein [Hyphomicrobiaceae bacterium]|nr:CAP domain-containing protein [Hyphomicrobiaceae bacterium]